MIRDQRSIYIGPNVETPEQVRALWEAMVAAASRERGEDIRLHDEADTLKAYVNEGRWVADCPACNGGIAAWPEHDKGACIDCGGVYSIEFPPARLIEKADVILSERGRSINPLTGRSFGPKVQHWNPETETLDRLQVENTVMGGLPEDFGGVLVGSRRLGRDELLAEYEELLQARRAHELKRGPRELGRGR